MDVEMLHQLSQRSITLDGGKSNLGLESRCVVTARSSAHSLSCSRLSSPLSGRNSTYRAVQICESSSALISYGADQRAIARRVAYYVDRILKGERAADIPVEQP